MSHTSLKNLESNIKFLQNCGVKNICVDSEGAQIRTANINKSRFLKKEQKIIFSNDESKKFYFQLYPYFDFNKIKINTFFKVGFDGLEFKVINKSNKLLKAKVVQAGKIENNKGVHFNQSINLHGLTNKDVKAIKIAKKLKVKYFALSFANNVKIVAHFRKLIGNNTFLISKIETKQGYKNIKEITKNSDAVLIDRGDLSRYFPIESIPMVQKLILQNVKSLKKECYIATNLLESMLNNFYPTRAESNDIYSCLELGAKGLVLAAETAIGKYPEECVNFINKCIIKRDKFLRFGKF